MVAIHFCRLAICSPSATKTPAVPLSIAFNSAVGHNRVLPMFSSDWQRRIVAAIPMSI
jgi:hypothetical protein